MFIYIQNVALDLIETLKTSSYKLIHTNNTQIQFHKYLSPPQKQNTISFKDQKVGTVCFMVQLMTFFFTNIIICVDSTV